MHTKYERTEMSYPNTPNQPQPQMYAPNQFMPGVQPTGYPATPAATGYGANPMGLLASMAMSKQLGGIFGSSSSSSFSSASKDVSIIKYDEYFKKESPNWCLENLKKKNGDPALTADEIKANPPLGLKFKGCDLIIPIPNPKAMCKTNDELLRQIMGNHPSHVSDDVRKRNTDELSQALLIQYVDQCGYGTDAFTDGFCPKPNMVSSITDQDTTDLADFRRQRGIDIRSGNIGTTPKRLLRDIMGKPS